MLLKKIKATQQARMLLKRTTSYRATVIVLLVGLLAPQLGWAQVRHLLSGTVLGTDGTALPGATVAVLNLGIGTTTDVEGRYRLDVLAGPQDVTVSFIGYLPQTFRVNLSRSQQRSLTLAPNPNELGEVVVQGQQTLREKLETTQMGVEHLTIREAKSTFSKPCSSSPACRAGAKAAVAFSCAAVQLTRTWCCSTTR
jgi:hypothetical protein